MSNDLIMELGTLPSLLRKKNFRQVKILYSDTVYLWTCIIEYGNSEFLVGYGVDPRSAVESVLEILDLYIEDGMPKMEQREILEKYDPIGLKLVDERWGQS